MVTHIDCWFAFLDKFRTVDMEELILVTGCHRAKDWHSVAFNYNGFYRADGTVNWQTLLLDNSGSLHDGGPTGVVRSTPRSHIPNEHSQKFHLETS
jgi:hypothetical protein